MALGAAALVLGSGLTDGIAHQLTDNLVAVQTGHLQVVARATDFVPQNSPFDAYGLDPITDGVALAARIEAAGRAAGIARAVPYLHARGTAMAGNRSSLANLVGIDPLREPELQKAQAVAQGTFLSKDDPLGVYVAAPVARKMRVGLGDTVSFVIQTSEGAVNSVDGVVVGIFKKSAPWYDNTFYIPIGLAQTLVDRPGAATNIKILLQPGASPARAREGVERTLPAPRTFGKGLEIRVEGVEQAGRFSYSVIQANDSALTVLSTFLFLAAAVGIVNAMLMSVHERTREIGTVRALGMRRRAVVQLFLLEGLALGVVAAAVGVVIGGALVLHWGARGIPMNTMTLAWIAGGDRLFPILRAAAVLRAGVTIALLSTLAAVYPARLASRLEPREALTHV